MQQFLGRLRLRTEQDGLMSTPFRLALTLLIGSIVAIAAGFAADYFFRDGLQLRALTIAASMDVPQLETINKEGQSANQKEYQRLKVRLAQLKLVDRDARNIYVLNQGQQGVFVVADSESPDSPDYASYGTARSSTTNIQLSELFDNPDSRVALNETNGGSRISAFAPVIDYQSGDVVAIVGIDVPTTIYFAVIAISSLLCIIITLVLCILIVFLDKARTRRLETLRFRSELVSIASHELRTPLTGIRWSEEGMLNDKSLDTKHHHTLEQMYDSTLRLQESIEDILQLASLQNQKASVLNKTPSDITRMITDIYATQKLPASQHGIKLEFDPEWPKDLIVQCDQLRMKRVFNNVISNAIKYTRPNTTVTAHYDHIDGNHVISISDQGIGIPKAEQEKVFSGFYRATNAVKHETNGTGMGLYLSKTVIEQHGGTIWLKSTPNKGTTVFIRLPD